MSLLRFASQSLRDSGRRKGVLPPRRPARPRLALEALDERSLPSATFVQTNLVSNLPGVARIQDPNLIDPIGIAVDSLHTASQSFGFAIANLLSNRGEVFALGGQPLNRPSSVSLGVGAPTGVVFNATGSATDFPVTGFTTRPAAFLFATSVGEIIGWNPLTGEQDAFGNIQTFSTTGHVVFQARDAAGYSGLTFGQVGAANFLYAVDALCGEKIDVIDSQFHKVPLGTNGFESFTDPNMPAGYGPFNIQNINGRLYVTYVEDGTRPTDPVAGHGFIDVFETNGHFDGRLVTGGDLNRPYGLALAPAGFGDFGGALLVGNIGDGLIHAFNPTTGTQLGTLNGPDGKPLAITSLHGLTFGAGAGKVGDANTLYFTASFGDGSVGAEQSLFGSIAVNPDAAPHVASVVVNGAAAQRSMVTQIQVTFDQHVSLPVNAADAFRLARQGDGAAANLVAAVDDLGSGTVVTLNFVGGAVEPSLSNILSLADGRYTLSVLAGQAGGVNGALDGDGDGTGGGDFVLAGNPANGLFRLFGDVNGDGAVNGLDLTAFRAAFGTVSPFGSPFDVNEDGAVNGLDLTAFRARFGVTV